MSAENAILGETADAGSTRDVFALTDEQIVGLGAEEAASDQGRLANQKEEGNSSRAKAQEAGGVHVAAEAATHKPEEGAQPLRDSLRGSGQAEGGPYKGKGADGRSNDRPLHEEESGTGAAAALEVPQWLAERMKDPLHGQEAKELWDGKQRAEKETAAYREVFATAADVRALKEIYPGGVSEAKSAAERARALDEIDAAFYRGDAPARMQLAQRMMMQDPAAFREMVEAGVRLLGGAEKRSLDELNGVHATENLPGSLRSVADVRAARTEEEVGHSGRDDNGVGPEVARAYGEFEKAANAELEKSVGGAIARVMEQALPNLRMNGAAGREGAQGTAPLQNRLAGAVREEVEAGRRFDGAARAQVVRLIDARAQELVPGAVRRVVGSWTQATLGARGAGRDSAGAEHGELGEAKRSVATSATRKDGGREASGRNERQSAARREAEAGRGRRVDYRKISDEEILGL